LYHHIHDFKLIKNAAAENKQDYFRVNSQVSNRIH